MSDYLSKDEARRLYDRLGHRQDWLAFYDGPPLRELLAHGRFGEARAVFELGCGTGALAQSLLEGYLSAHAGYVGVDLSSTMVALAGARLARYKDRARVLQTDGAMAFPFPDGSFDRVVATYVLDLLSPDDIERFIQEAARLLASDGLLCLVNLTHGAGLVSRLVMALWKALYRLSPARVGGCRPLEVRAFLDPNQWRIEYHHVVASLGVPSEILVAERRHSACWSLADDARR